MHVRFEKSGKTEIAGTGAHLLREFKRYFPKH